MTTVEGAEEKPVVFKFDDLQTMKEFYRDCKRKRYDHVANMIYLEILKLEKKQNEPTPNS
ncbi:MAG: hypothetical protein M3044_06605 [Thermoproteota archaeon]|nr:hypothetical protein [Thermoproteota archaeon]